MTDPKLPDSQSQPPKSSGPYISSRLREKLAEGGDAEWSPKSSNPLPGIIGTIVILGVLVATFMWWQSSVKKEETKKAAAAAEAARIDSLQTAARAESIATAYRADSTAKAVAEAAHPGKKPAPTPTAAAKPGAKPASGTATVSKPAAGAKTAPATSASSTPATPAPKPVATDGFGIAVGQFMLEDRANSEKDKLAAATGLPGKVAPVDDGGTTVYRVILGKWASRAPAEKKATALIDSSLVHEARVVARPK